MDFPSSPPTALAGTIREVVGLAESTGYVPCMKGRLNPIRDSRDRTYLYASNIAIDGGKQQPVHFALGEKLHLTDADGAEATVRIVDLVGGSALLEYRPVTGDQPRFGPPSASIQPGVLRGVAAAGF